MEPFAKRSKVEKEEILPQGSTAWASNESMLKDEVNYEVKQEVNTIVHRPEMRDFLTAASIIEFAQSGRVREIAPGMKDLIGMDIDLFRSVPAKDAACRFFQRYIGKSISKQEQVDHFHFEWAWQNQDVVATLVTTSFFMKRYVGRGRTQPLAEISAFEQFRKDPIVLEVCRNLPPPLENIRRRVQMKSWQKEALRAEGHDPAAILTQLGDDLYLAFRDMGCRTATWDFNI